MSHIFSPSFLITVLMTNSCRPATYDYEEWKQFREVCQQINTFLQVSGYLFQNILMITFGWLNIHGCCSTHIFIKDRNKSHSAHHLFPCSMSYCNKYCLVFYVYSSRHLWNISEQTNIFYPHSAYISEGKK